MSTIDEKLNELEQIKNNIRTAVNTVYGSVIISNSTKFSEFSNIIVTNLQKKSANTYNITYTKKYINSNGTETTEPEIVTLDEGEMPSAPEVVGNEFTGSLPIFVPATQDAEYILNYSAKNYEVVLNYGWNGTENTDTSSCTKQYGSVPSISDFSVEPSVEGYVYSLPTFNHVNTTDNTYSVSYTEVDDSVTMYVYNKNYDNSEGQEQIDEELMLAISDEINTEYTTHDTNVPLNNEYQYLSEHMFPHNTLAIIIPSNVSLNECWLTDGTEMKEDWVSKGGIHKIDGHGELIIDGVNYSVYCRNQADAINENEDKRLWVKITKSTTMS